jgi:hypothetical protein
MVNQTTYDVFLSHNSTDKPAVEILARRLVEAGLTPWLDKWNLVPGEPWQEAIEGRWMPARPWLSSWAHRASARGRTRKCARRFLYQTVLKHECHKGTNDTNLVGNDRAAFVKFAHSRFS